MIKMLNKRLFLLLGLCVMLWASCSTDKAPDYLISEDDVVPILVDVHLIDAYFYEMYEPAYLEEYMSDSMSIAYSAIFEKHGVTADRFTKSIDYYSDRPETFRAIYEKVILQLNNK